MLYQDFDVRGAFQRFTNLSADVYRGAYTPSKFRTLHERLTLLLYLYLSIWSGKIFIILIREELKASKVKFSQRFLSGRFEFSCRDLFININTRKTFGNECAEIRAEKTFERQRKGTGTRSNLSRTKIMARDANDVTFKRWMEFVRGIVRPIWRNLRNGRSRSRLQWIFVSLITCQIRVCETDYVSLWTYRVNNRKGIWVNNSSNLSFRYIYRER